MADRSFLDWPLLEDHHRVVAAELDAWCAANLPTSHDDVDAACRELVSRLGTDGWLRHSANLDRPALDVRSLCLIRETLARHDALADFAFAMQGLGMGPVTLFGDERQKQWLQRTTAGTAIAGFALSEPASGSDVANLATTAAKDGRNWVLNGEKTWISNGGIADIYTVFARTGEAPGARGLSCFLVPADTAGLKIEERIDVIAPHPLARLSFDGMRLPESALIGNAGKGFGIAMAVLDVFRSTVGAAALGLARRALDEALARVTTRELFGAPMAMMPTVQASLAEMALDIDASALLVYRAAWTKDAGAERISREASMAKLHATEIAQKVIDKALQLHGGDGVRSGQAIEKLYREVRALRIYEGASEVQKQIIAKQMLSSFEAE